MLENQQIQLKIDPVTGNITNLIKVATGHDFTNFQNHGGLNTFRWVPGDSDEALSDSAIAISVVESGPLIVELQVKSRARGCRSVTRSMRLYI